MKKLVSVLVLLVVIISCNENNNDSKTQFTDIKEMASPAADSCAEPFLFTDRNGLVYLSWIEKVGKESKLKFSSLEKENWTAPVTIASGNDWFVNWADYPALAADGNGNMIAHYLQKSDTGKFTYDVKYVMSSDKGTTWSKSKFLNEDEKEAEHGFVSISPYGENYILSWLDGRNAAAVEGAGHEGHHGEMTIRGAVLKKDGTKENEWELDNKVCDCCQTSTANTDNGPVVVYRDRSDEEIRDMSIVRFVNGNWTAPKTIFADNWKIAGCPVNGPRAAAIGNNLAITWFSMKDNTGEVKIIFSEDGGATFNKPIRVDEGNTIGRVAVVMLDKSTAAVCWMDGAEIKLTKVNADGKKEKPVLIASSSDARSSGFPQMTKNGDRLIFAWTDNKAKTIKLSGMDLK